jgi:hypothetical protein
MCGPLSDMGMINRPPESKRVMSRLSGTANFVNTNTS